jgi:hypothetical protein
MKKRILKSLWYVVPAAAFLLFLAVFMEARAHERLSLARKALEAHDAGSAIVYYFQAINWYSPVGSSQTAADELSRLGENLSRKDNRELSYQAFLRLRSALNAARSFYFPRKGLLDKANREISLYLAELRTGQPLGAAETQKYANFYYRIYHSTPRTNEGWYLAVLAGFFLWTISAIRVIFRLFGGQNDKLRDRLFAARAPITLFFAGYLLWLVSMRIA